MGVGSSRKCVDATVGDGNHCPNTHTHTHTHAAKCESLADECSR